LCNEKITKYPEEKLTKHPEIKKIIKNPEIIKTI